MTFHFVVNPPREEIKRLILTHHYSKRMPSGCMYSFGLRDGGGLLVAAITFSSPAGRWHEPVVELSRLVRVEADGIPLVSLISRSVREIKKARKHDLIISFADSTHGHHGGVYQAASWNYSHTKVPAIDGFVVDGLFVPSRTCNTRWGTCLARELPRILALRGVVAIPHRDSGKHVYWKALSRSGEQKALALHLDKREYPKPLLRPVTYSWQRFRASRDNANDKA